MIGGDKKTKDPSGRFTVRLEPDLHSRLRRMSHMRRLSINDLLILSIERELSEWESSHCPTCGRKMR